MKEMINTQIALNRKLQKKQYSNGQLAVFVHDYNDEPLAELSIMCNFNLNHPSLFRNLIK